MSKMKTGVGPQHSGHGTTTLSTIAVKSGETKLVIALLHSGSRDAPSLQLRILDMDPEFAWLGNNFTEATSLQKQQQQVMEKLHNKQSPVEELLRQAGKQFDPEIVEILLDVVMEGAVSLDSNERPRVLIADSDMEFVKLLKFRLTNEALEVDTTDGESPSGGGA